MGIEEYLADRAKREVEGKSGETKRLIMETELSDKHIARLTGVPIEFVQKLRAEIEE